MKRFTNETEKHLPVELQINDSPVYFIGPASRDNPMSQIRTKLMGTVYFHDRKIKWNRVTLQFVGKAGIDIEAPRSSLSFAFTGDMNDSASTRINTVVPICEVEKELIFSGEESIGFGLHLPSHLPASNRTNHAFVEYTLIANFSAGAFFKKYKTHKTVTICRHYLPSPSAMIPTMKYSGIKEWFEWSVELPKAAAIQSGEIVAAFRCSVEKERVEIDRVELAVEEIESYRFCTKQGVQNLPPIIIKFPSAVYHMPSLSDYSDTHFIRVPLSTNDSHPKTPTIRTHQYDPFLEISHRCRLTVHFQKLSNMNAEPVILHFPVIITDYPSTVTSDMPSSNNFIETEAETSNSRHVIVGSGGDDAVNVDLELPEYTPRYEEFTSTPTTSVI
ncbi:hypothetical protein G6F46_002250 [Rhizopus delemar]|nr:hypothetical protein G6F55_005365 [Rhizopus delemar]KAG1551379.1 hypothetical protein G6F51_001874 [Rhizopus arrhizus]KAG1498316.1 hypothetical protein G6F54_005165 [Rhizopus delemar]KAG1516883.1 hypothetical protein G6F53_001815 [Rhizopus delemar]KAG1519902.1 hypothetical protein G6F52_008172 [Rhizopus delemar]